MLDIYRVPDEKLVQHRYEDITYIGSLDMVEHKSLRCVWQHPEGLTLKFFEDTYLSSQQVQRMLAIAWGCQNALEQSGNLGNNAYKKLIGILERATVASEGIVAVCD